MSLKLRNRRLTILLPFLLVMAIVALAAVPRGSPEKATAYYQNLAKILEFTDSAKIFNSTLDDVTSYLGYPGLSGADICHQIREFNSRTPIIFYSGMADQEDRLLALSAQAYVTKPGLIERLIEIIRSTIQASRSD